MVGQIVAGQELFSAYPYRKYHFSPILHLLNIFRSYVLIFARQRDHLRTQSQVNYHATPDL
jgi:hypothetical protein